MVINIKWRPPAITTGLILFYLLLALLIKTDNLTLTPDALFKLNLNRLSFYPLVFVNIWHLVLGVILFTPLCGMFELKNGTVRTGIVLNLTAFLPGIISNIIAKVSNNKLASAPFCGTSSWILAFSAFLSVSAWTLPVIPFRNIVVSTPAWVFPLLGYAVLSYMSFQFVVLHGLALLMGFGLGLLRLEFLVEGTSRPVEYIESKLAIGIDYLRYIVRFVGESEARDLRRLSLVARRRSMAAVIDDIPLPAATLTNPVA